MNIIYDFNVEGEDSDIDIDDATRTIYEIDTDSDNVPSDFETRYSHVDEWTPPPCPYNKKGEYVPRSRRDGRKKLPQDLS